MSLEHQGAETRELYLDKKRDLNTCKRVMDSIKGNKGLLECIVQENRHNQPSNNIGYCLKH